MIRSADRLHACYMIYSWTFIVANADGLFIAALGCLWLGFPFFLWFFLKRSNYGREQATNLFIWLAYILMALVMLPGIFLYMSSWISGTQTSAMDGLFVVVAPFLMLSILGLTFMIFVVFSLFQKRKDKTFQRDRLDAEKTNAKKKIFSSAFWVIGIILIFFAIELLSWFLRSNALYEEIQKLHKAGKDISVIVDFDGKSYLHQAALGRDFNSVQFLISVGADINIRNQRGDTPLFDAAYAGDTSIVRLLLEADAEINSMNNFGQTPLIRASRKGHVDIVQLLLSEGADPNLCGDDEWPPLMKAIQYGYIDVARVLLKNGADITYEDSRGNTPLSIAHQKNNKHMIDLLMQTGK